VATANHEGIKLTNDDFPAEAAKALRKKYS